MEKFEQECIKFLKQCKSDGLTEDDINKLCYKNLKDKDVKQFYAKELKKQGRDIGINKKFGFCCWCVIPCVLAVIVGGLVTVSYRSEELVDLFGEHFKSNPCLMDHNEISLELTRPLFNCSLCAALTSVPVETNLSQARFEELYAYVGVPVLVRGTAESWAARNVFSFEFFKALYTDHEGALQMVEDECQFFPYNTDFRTLRDVFHMSKEMSELKQEKWYVGWSNCVPSVETELRRHYAKPDFLPASSVSSRLDWIFMGGWGHGAPTHLDNVARPSWQAQLSGTKTWTLVPAPECESQCHTLEVKVNTGDIIVVDTNQWYHSTYIHEGQISITIGSEYD